MPHRVCSVLGDKLGSVQHRSRLGPDLSVTQASPTALPGPSPPGPLSSQASLLPAPSPPGPLFSSPPLLCDFQSSSFVS